MESRRIFFIPIAPILVILLGAVVTACVFTNMVGQWIYAHRWYIFAFFCLVFLINFILILKASDIICAMSFLIAVSPVLYYIINRSTLFVTNENVGNLNLDYILCVIFYIGMVILLSVAVFSLSWILLDKYNGGTALSESYRDATIYFLKMLAVSAVGWGIDALIFFVVVPIYSFDY